MKPIPHKQRGATLIIVMVLLIAMTWFAVSGYRLTAQHLQLVNNTQERQHAVAAAQRAIEETISSSLFTKDPAAVAATPLTTDIDGDGHADYTAMLVPAPMCYRLRIVKTSELDLTSAKDRVCLQSSGGGGGVAISQPGAAITAGNSLCSASEWDVAARVDDARSGASVVVHQGISLRLEVATANNNCK